MCLQILKFKVCVSKAKLNYKMFNKVLYINTVICVYEKYSVIIKSLKVNIHKC